MPNNFVEKTRLGCFILIMLLSSFGSKAKENPLADQCGSNTVDDMPGIYIGGFVRQKIMDDQLEQYRGVEDAIITVTYEGEWLYDLRTTENGWYESSQPIKAACMIGQILNLSFLKYQFFIKNEPVELKTGLNKLDVELVPVFEGGITRDYYQEPPTRTFYGHVIDDNKQILPGSRASLIVNDEEISVGYSRDSGYFSINYAGKYQGEEGNLLVEKFSYIASESKKITISDNLPLQETVLTFQKPTNKAIGIRYSSTFVDSTNNIIDNYLGVSVTAEYYPSTTMQNEYSNPTKIRKFSKSNFSYLVGLGIAFPDRKSPKTPGGSLNTNNLEYTFGAGYRLTDFISLQISLSLLKEDGEWIKGANLGFGIPVYFF